MIKDYFLCEVQQGAQSVGHFWCSSTSWVFSELPQVRNNAKILARLKQINTLFTGEFDQVLFQSDEPPTVIDAEMGVVMQAKPITELDRLSFVYH